VGRHLGFDQRYDIAHSLELFGILVGYLARTAAAAESD
jgi:hypothetical protein